MSSQELLCRAGVSIRKLPVNFSETDSGLFEHEVQRVIPETKLLKLRGIEVNPYGILFRGNEVLPESFPSPRHLDTWVNPKMRWRFLRRLHSLTYKRLKQDVLWFTDIWSAGYFHWMTDALPRLFVSRGVTDSATILLPGPFEEMEYVRSSLIPFAVRDVKFVREKFICKNFILPTHTAPTGNYNEPVMRALRSLYTDFYRNTRGAAPGDKVYVSRSRAERRRIVNEEEVVNALKHYGFETVHFEDYSFEQQVKIALGARYLISNHGAGLTNMLFMKSGGSVLELRREGDAHNNCYFALASALGVKYFYQLCDSENPDEDAHTANLIVDEQKLRRTVEQMLSV